MLLLALTYLLLMGCEHDSGQLAQIEDATSVAGYQPVVATQPKPANRFYFDHYHNVVPAKYQDTLKARAQYLLQHPHAKVLLIGYTSTEGHPDYNLAMGQRYANAIASVLRMQGVPAHQIQTLSYGAAKPMPAGDYVDGVVFM